MSDGKDSRERPEDLVRVLRIVEYTGPRAAVEECVAKSIHGERRFGPHGKEIAVRVATIGEYPEILDTPSTPIAPSLYTVGWENAQGPIGSRSAPGDLAIALQTSPFTIYMWEGAEGAESRIAYIYAIQDNDGDEDAAPVYEWDGPDGWKPVSKDPKAAWNAS